MSSVTEQEFGSLLSIINRCDDGQTRRAVEAIQNRRAAIVRQKIGSILVGSRVKWNGKHGHKTGTVLRVKQKYVEVRDDEKNQIGISMTWNVPANMLEPE